MVEQNSHINDEQPRHHYWTRTDTRIHQLGLRLAFQLSTMLATIAFIAGVGSLIYWQLSEQKDQEPSIISGIVVLIIAGHFLHRVLRRLFREALAATIFLNLVAIAFTILPLRISSLQQTGTAALIVIAIIGRVVLTPQHSKFLMTVCMIAAAIVILSVQTSTSTVVIAGNVIIVLGLTYIGQHTAVRYFAALKNDYRLMRVLIDTIPNNLFVKDRESRIIIDNIAHAQLLNNSTPDQVVGKSDFDYFAPELAQKYYDDEQQLMSSDQVKITVEEETVDPYGKRLWILTTKVIIRDEQDRVTGIAGINHDITAIKEAQMENDSLLKATRTQQESLVTLIDQMARTASELSQSAADIQATTSQQAATATEQDAAVMRTLATVEDVRDTVSQSSERADNVRNLATQSMDTSHKGQLAVNDTIEGMELIQRQVENIAENILTLSSKTQQIGEIIETVNALADQSKLLALNASIEAAHAGEQGKGFSIVAAEVRQLAAQSNEATARIRTILDEIQQATNAVVVATEEGSKSSQRGMALANRAGEAIRDLSTVIETSAQAATQITATAQHQLNGMDQLANAMNQIKRATAQFTISSRQTEENIRKLTEIAQQLEKTATLSGN